MLEIIAEENATVTKIADSFQLGKQNAIKIHIRDSIVKNRINLLGTGTCLDSNNYYSYGKFNDKEDLLKINYSLNNNSFIGITNDVDYGKCLYINSSVGSNTGFINLYADRCKLKPFVKYKLTLLYKCTDKTSLVGIDSNNNELINSNLESNNTWIQYKSDEFFVTKESDFNLYIKTLNGGLCCIKNLALFESNKELLDELDDIKVEIDVINPQQDTKINHVINWVQDKDNDDVFIVLYVPPITVVDFQDKLTCKVRIYQPMYGKHEMFGDIQYTDCEELIYQSEAFVLQGLIMPVSTGGSSSGDVTSSIPKATKDDIGKILMVVGCDNDEACTIEWVNIAINGGSAINSNTDNTTTDDDDKGSTGDNTGSNTSDEDIPKATKDDIGKILMVVEDNSDDNCAVEWVNVDINGGNTIK